MHGLADVHLISPVANEVGGFEDAGCDGGHKQLLVPKW